ncbi:hypothetical protein EON64_11955, partial [archaeon]
MIMNLHKTIGNHWCRYTDSLPGRTDCAIKNRYHVLSRNSQKALKSESEDTKGSKTSKTIKASKATNKKIQYDSDDSREQQEEAMMAADERRIPLIGSSDYMDLSSSSNAEIPLTIEIPPADPNLNELEQDFVDLCKVPGPGMGGEVGMGVAGEHHASGSSQSTKPAYHLNTFGSLAGLFALDSLSNEALNTRSLLPGSECSLFSPPALRHKQQTGDAMNSISSQHWFSITPLQQASSSPLTPMIYSFDTPNLPPLKRQKMAYPYNYVA